MINRIIKFNLKNQQKDSPPSGAKGNPPSGANAKPDAAATTKKAEIKKSQFVAFRSR